MIGVIDIERVEELQLYQTAWNELRAETRVMEHVPTWDQLIDLHRCVPETDRVRVHMVVARGTVVGIWPLVVRRTPTRWGVTRRLTSLCHGSGIWQGPIGPHLAASLHAILHHLRGRYTDWDVFEFRQILECSRLWKRLTTALAAQGFQPRQDVDHELGVLDIPSDQGDHAERTARQAAITNWRPVSVDGVTPLVRHVSYRWPDGTQPDTGTLARVVQLPACQRHAIVHCCSGQSGHTGPTSVESGLSMSWLESLFNRGSDAAESGTTVELHGVEVAGELQAAAINILECGSWENVWLAADQPALISELLRHMYTERLRLGAGRLWIRQVVAGDLPDGCTQILKTNQLQCYRLSPRSQWVRWNRRAQQLVGRHVWATMASVTGRERKQHADAVAHRGRAALPWPGFASRKTIVDSGGHSHIDPTVGQE